MIYLTKHQLLPSLFAWGYVAGNLPRPIRDQKRPLDADADLPTVRLYIPAEHRSMDGVTHAQVTWVADHKLYRVEWIKP